MPSNKLFDKIIGEKKKPGMILDGLYRQSFENDDNKDRVKSNGNDDIINVSDKAQG